MATNQNEFLFNQSVKNAAEAPVSLGDTLTDATREYGLPASSAHGSTDSRAIVATGLHNHGITETSNQVLTDSSGPVLNSLPVVVAPCWQKDAGQRTGSGRYAVPAPIVGTLDVVVVALGFYHARHVATGLTRLPGGDWQVQPRSYNV